MTDIHAHVLPGVDDGARNMKTSLTMLRMAADSGVGTIVATPHCNIPGQRGGYVSEELEELFLELKARTEDEGLPIELVRGMEVYATADIADLLSEGRIWTLGSTSYFLVEFSFSEDPEFCRQILKKCREAGFRPVIAHPERYSFVREDPQIAYRWCVSGCALQINKGSLLGRFGSEVQHTAERLVRHGLAACVASDAHGASSRSAHMREISVLLAERFGEDMERLLLKENPGRILEDRELLGYTPIPFDR